MRSLIIVGCGGFGREVYVLLEALSQAEHGWQCEGFVDDAPTPADIEQVERLGCRVLGSVDWLSARGVAFAAVLAVGSAETRIALMARLQSNRVSYPALVHPDASIGSGVTLGIGTVVAAGARLSTNIRVGRHVQIDQNVTVGHDCRISDFSRLNPSACIGGCVTIGAQTLVGANSTVLQGLSVGDGVTVGAAACVVTDLPPGTTAKGVPASWASDLGPPSPKRSRNNGR